MENVLEPTKPLGIPRGIAMFVLVHVLAVAAMGVAASRVGEHFEDASQTDGHHMRLVPLQPVAAAQP